DVSRVVEVVAEMPLCPGANLVEDVVSNHDGCFSIGFGTQSADEAVAVLVDCYFLSPSGLDAISHAMENLQGICLGSFGDSALPWACWGFAAGLRVEDLYWFG